MKSLSFPNGHQMPILGLGTWQSKPGEVHQAVKEAVKLGYRHIDCAHVYGNEGEIGQALSELFSEGVVAREAMWITSKLWNNCHHPDHVAKALDKTLGNLKLDYLDLYLMHWPVAIKKGSPPPWKGEDFISLEELPLADTWGAMEALVEAGKCRHLGGSNFSATKLKIVAETAKIKPTANQVEMHPYLQQPKLVEYCQANNVHLTAYSPLGSPQRPKGMKQADEPVLMEDEKVLAVAEKVGATPAQVLISWAIHRNISVIPKSINPERIKQNLAAGEVKLDEGDMAELASLDRHRRYVDGSFWTVEGSPYTLANLWDE